MVKFSQERRERNRVTLDLPLDFQVAGSSHPYGGIAVNGSERGILLYSLLKMPIGTELKVDVLFPDEFQLARFEVKAKIVRMIRYEAGHKGYAYGARILRIDEADYRKLRGILVSRGRGLNHGRIEPSSKTEPNSNSDARGWQRKKKERSLRSFLLDLVGIIRSEQN